MNNAVSVLLIIAGLVAIAWASANLGTMIETHFKPEVAGS